MTSVVVVLGIVVVVMVLWAVLVGWHVLRTVRFCRKVFGMREETANEKLDC